MQEPPELKMGNDKVSTWQTVPNPNTRRKIKELAAYREQFMKVKGRAPSLAYACYKMVIGPKTVKKYAPELVEKWKDINFHW
jgi:hypothetical protein